MNVNVVGDADHSNGFIRVKSSHGHLVINASVDGERRRTSQSSLQSAMFASSSLPLSSKKRSPLKDLGEVNGSCDVLLEAPCDHCGVGDRPSQSTRAL
jgi:hypothetical protein